MHTDVAGFYSVRRINAATNQVVEEIGPFHNDITNQGLNRLGTANVIARCYVGTGSAPPTITDSGMAAWLASTNTAQGSDLTERDPTATLYWVQQTRTWRFDAGVAAGNITEVGVGWHTTNTNPAPNTLWSRQLIRDGSGNPTSITVLAGEFLDVSYTLRFYPQLTDSTGTFTLTGPLAGTYNYVARHYAINTAPIVTQTSNLSSAPAAVGYANFVLQPITAGSPVGTALTTPANNAATYEDGSYRRVTSHAFSLNVGNNAAGISGIVFTPSISSVNFLFYRMQMSISPPIMKTADHSVTIRTVMTWGRYTP